MPERQNGDMHEKR